MRNRWRRGNGVAFSSSGHRMSRSGTGLSRPRQATRPGRSQEALAAIGGLEQLEAVKDGPHIPMEQWRNEDIPNSPREGTRGGDRDQSHRPGSPLAADQGYRSVAGPLAVVGRSRQA